jgi:hypothetical protein
LETTEFEQLIAPIKFAEVFNTENEYRISWTGLPTYTLAIELKNGQTKKIPILVLVGRINYFNAMNIYLR